MTKQTAEYHREYRRKNPERARTYYQKNKDRIKAREAIYRDKNRERIQERNKRHYSLTKDAQNLSNAKRYIRSKLALFEIIQPGGLYKCENCKMDDVRVLQFDHIHGSGSKLNLELFGLRSATEQKFRYYVNHPELARETLQILCANCNIIKRWSEKEGVKYTEEYSFKPDSRVFIEEMIVN